MQIRSCLFVAFFAFCFIKMIGQQTEVQTTKFRRPPTVVSNEATKEQLAYARSEGDAVDKCTEWIVNWLGKPAGTILAGEYKITFALSAPEGWYEFTDHKPVWKSPSGDAHLWIFVQDGADGRIVPDLPVKAVLKDEMGSVINNKDLLFAWMPLLHGYGDNVKLAGKGNYILQLEIGPLPFHRHDPYNGDRFYKNTLAEVHIFIDPETVRSKVLSDEMEKQDFYAISAGNAYENTLKAMYRQAVDGKDTLQSDYFIAVAVEYSEGYWFFDEKKNNRFRYFTENDKSARTNAHVEVVVCDNRTKRFIPGLHVETKLYSTDNQSIGAMDQHFMWHPWLYHYGQNWRIPASGKYNIHVHFEPPEYRRYGKTQGKQFTTREDISFNNVTLKTGER